MRSEKGSPSMSDSPGQLARNWLRGARSDLNAAKTILRNPDQNDPFTAGFHAQQAAEKAIKAVLTARQIGFSHIHDLDKLQQLTPAGTTVKAISGLYDLTPYAAEQRYHFPGDEDAPTWAEVTAHTNLAEQVLAAATIDVGIAP